MFGRGAWGAVSGRVCVWRSDDMQPMQVNGCFLQGNRSLKLEISYHSDS